MNGQLTPRPAPPLQLRAVHLLMLIMAGLSSICYAEKGQETEPIVVRFETGPAPKLNQPAPVTVVVEHNPQGGPLKVAAGSRLELLLRLPEGVKLEDPNWLPLDQVGESGQGGAGPWLLYKWGQPVEWNQSHDLEGQKTLLRAPASLKVVEEGANWVITASVRLIHGQESIQASGVILATAQDSVAQFHKAPLNMPVPIDVDLDLKKKPKKDA